MTYQGKGRVWGMLCCDLAGQEGEGVGHVVLKLARARGGGCWTCCAVTYQGKRKRVSGMLCCDSPGKEEEGIGHVVL